MTIDQRKPASGMQNLLQWLGRMSLRSRLMLAFFILIISSATATIIIGNMVLGTQIFKLAKSKVEVDLKIAWQIWDARIDNMKHVTGIASRYPDACAGSDMVDSIMSQGVFDFAGVVDISGSLMAHSAIEENHELGPMPIVMEAIGTKQTIASAVMIPTRRILQEAPKLARQMEPFMDQPEVMVLMSVSPMVARDKTIVGAVYGAFLINGATDMVTHMVQMAGVGRTCHLDHCYAATVFQQGIRVSTSLHQDRFESPLLSNADDPVIREVLQKGSTYIGIAQVVSEPFYTAYQPIRDYRGNIIGMLGIGTTVSEYMEAQSHTILLFSTLIAGGLIFGIIMTLLFSWWLVKPVASLAEGMSRVAEGDLNYKIRIESADELGQLTRAFNRMVKAVKTRDMQLREMTENRLSEVEKQISIGRLAAGVAHEINNPLTAILSLSSLMLRHTPAGTNSREDLEIIVEETTRCREIVSGLLDFARETPTAKKVIDLNQVMKSTMSLANKYQATRLVDITVRYHKGPMYVRADAKQLQQVFINMTVNAAEALRDAQEQGLRDVSDSRIWITIDDDSSGDFALVEFRDNGVGIEENHLKRIFEPFFTTKGKSKGTGLGLSVSLGILQRHGGSIDIDSEPGKGTIISLHIPRHFESADTE